MKHAKRALLLAAFAGLALLACADKANPVVPLTGNPGSHTGGSAAIDALELGDADDTPTTLTTSSDASLTACDLLKQNCSSAGLGPGFACYPVSGAGRCEAAGGTGAFGTCTLDTDCVPGLVCVPQSSGFTFGYCAPICNLQTDPTASVCSNGYTCQPIPGFDKSTNVGRCTPVI